MIGKPFLRWAGSKRKMVPLLTRLWGNGFKRYLEPFMGSACPFFAIAPQSAILSDIKFSLVEVFQTVRQAPSQVASELGRFPQGKDAYYRIRADDNAKLSLHQRAAK